MVRPCAVAFALGVSCLLLPVTLVGEPPPNRALLARVEALEAAVADLQNASLPLELTVNCSAGETITAALDKVGFRPNYVTITVVGTCKERVLVRRDRTFIRGATVTDGLQSPFPSQQALVFIGRMFTLRDISVRGTIAAWGPSFTLTGVTITDCASDSGLNVSAYFGILDRSTITGCRNGVMISGGGTLAVRNSVIEGNSFIGVQVSGGQLDLNESVIRNNASFGLWVQAGLINVGANEGQSVRIEGNRSGVGVNSGGSFNANGPGVLIGGNADVGVAIFDGASAVLGGGARVADTTAGPGMFIRGGGHIRLEAGTIIENNAKGGVHIQNLGTGDFKGAIIRNNRFSGIGVSTLSFALFGDGQAPPNEIVNNEFWGVGCSNPPDVALISGVIGNASGNGSGTTNCTCVGGGC
jgi:hypothetical protein